MKRQSEVKDNIKPKNSLKMYSEYGYVEVDKDDYEDSCAQQVKFIKADHKLEGKISKATLTETVTVNLKTLYGSRRTYSFEVNVKNRLSVLVERLIEEELKSQEKIKWNVNYQYRIICTNGIIKELNPNSTFFEEEIKHNFTLILASPYKLMFSDIMKHQGIQLEELNSVAHNLSGAEEHLLVLCDRGYKTGSNYFEFTLLTEPCQNSVIVGVTHMRSDYYFHMDDHRNFWGYNTSEGTKIGNNDNVEVGIPCKINDKIGLLTSFHKAGMDLKLYINNSEICTLFKNLPLGHYYFPCAILKFDGMKIKISNRVPVPSSE